MKALLGEILEYKESFWIGGNSGAEMQTDLNFRTWFGHWMKKRFESKHMMYDLADYGCFLKGYPPTKISQNKAKYYQICYLPKNLSSPMVIVIFGDKVGQILWSKQSFAFVIESNEIKASFLKYFNYFWKSNK